MFGDPLMFSDFLLKLNRYIVVFLEEMKKSIIPLFIEKTWEMLFRG